MKRGLLFSVHPFRFILLVLLVLVVTLASIPSRGVQAAAGDFDLGFGNGGKVTTDFAGNYDNGFALALQNDGKIILAGGTYLDTVRIDFALARYNQNGSPDSSFGSGGKVHTTFPFSAGISAVNNIAIQPDGKIVAAGTTYGNGFYDFALAL